MKRKNKNIVMLLLIIILIVSTFFTMKLASKSTMVNIGTNQNSQTPPDMPNNNMEQPPEKPSNDNNDSTTSEQDESSNNPQDGMQSPPEKPSGDNQPGDPSENMFNSTQDTTKKISPLYIIFAGESLLLSLLIFYLLMSKFNKKTFKETISSGDKLIIYILSVVIITCAITYLDTFIYNNYFKSVTAPNKEIGTTSNDVAIQATAATVIDNQTKTLNDSYSSSTIDESVILVKNGGNLTLENATVNKSSGDSSNTENSEFYGINSGILVTSNSTATIKNTKISTNSKGSNAVFSTGENSKIYIENSTITTTGSSSARGLDATYGGYIEADNVTIKTQGDSCATLATDRGEGTVIAKNSNLETNGTGSPIIYSTGNITITNTTGTAHSSQMVVIEGKNSATVKDSNLDASGTGNRNTVDQAGVMIYQSMSGDASEGTGTFTSTNSSLTIQETSSYYKTAPMFFITNTDAVINLENTKLVYGSNLLISAKATTEWGNEGSNGANLTFNANNQSLKGDIEIDEISTLKINLTSSSYTGTINNNNTAKNISLKLDKNSKITLTNDSYITSLDNADSTNNNIDFNNHILYVNGKAIN